MLLDLRETQNNYIIRIIFFITIAGMVLGTVLSAFMGGSNPIVLKSSVGEIRRNDLFARGQPWALIFQHLNTQDPKEVPVLLNQYLLPKIYQDFFTHHRFEMSDRLAWGLFLQRFHNEKLSPEKVQALNQAIQQQYGSKSEFLKQLKVQLYTIAMQEALYAIGQPLSPEFDIQHKAANLERHTHIYTYVPEDFYAQISQPTPEELQAFYESHLQQYTLGSSLDIEYFLLTPAQVNLPAVDSDEYQQAVASLQNRGYEEITPALVQQSLYHQIIEEVNAETSPLSFNELQALLKEKGIAEQYLSAKAFSSMREDDLDDLFEQPGLYNVAYTVYTSQQKAVQHYGLSEEQELFMYVTNHNEGGPQRLEEIAYQVSQDWKKERAFELALEHAQGDYQQYCQTSDITQLKRYHHHKELSVSDLFSDARLNNEMKVALATLYDPRISAAKSARVLPATDGDHINIMIMSELAASKPYSQLPEDAQRFNLDDFAQKELLHKMVDTDVSEQFSYQIVSPEFWSFVERS